MTDNAKKVFGFLLENAKGNDLTARDVADECGVSIQAVTGTFNGLVKKGYAYREEVEVENDKKKMVTIKYLRLNEEAYSYDPDAK